MYRPVLSESDPGFSCHFIISYSEPVWHPLYIYFYKSQTCMKERKALDKARQKMYYIYG